VYIARAHTSLTQDYTDFHFCCSLGESALDHLFQYVHILTRNRFSYAQCACH